MASDAPLPEVDTQEDLVTKHRKEKKELQAQIQKLKNSVPKGDKKKKKEVTEEIAKLEADLASRHQQELSTFKVKEETDQCNSVGTEEIKTELDTESKQHPETTGKKSKAQKRREKKEDAERERTDRIRAQAVENLQGPRHREMARIKEMLKNKRLQLHEIPADGNCLYNAVSHQLSQHCRQHSTSELRLKTSEYMREHKDDFLPFLTHPDTGNVLTDEEFEAYCDQTAATPVWGGQVELRALSEVLCVPIEVLQAETDPLVVGDVAHDKPLTLVYHRHIYRLGEHYNSVMAAPPQEGEEEEEAES